MCVYYLEQNFNKSIELIESSLSLGKKGKFSTFEEIEILISLGVFYCEYINYKKGVSILLNAIDNLNFLPFIKDDKVKIRLYYNISKAYHQQKLFNESIKYANKGIKNCIKLKTIYLLGHCYYQKGESLFYMEQTENAIKNMNEALWVFEKTEDKLLYHYVSSEINKIERLNHPKDFSDVIIPELR
ncbi:hypothetical protein ACERII_24075 [Evansella sp. AB-rgal1]|uniref:hypothetical protein n=1 Tax=Evansella sp. AB-rgal1 TaxID=3242696 RepID=UPI00359E3418